MVLAWNPYRLMTQNNLNNFTKSSTLSNKLVDFVPSYQFFGSATRQKRHFYPTFSTLECKFYLS